MFANRNVSQNERQLGTHFFGPLYYPNSYQTSGIQWCMLLLIALPLRPSAASPLAYVFVPAVQ